MKDKIIDIRDGILDFILKYNLLISIVIAIITLLCFNKTLIEYFATQKTEILNMLISTSGTLFGFILTFLSIFIVFKTDEKYKKNKDNNSNPLILLINNKSFNDIYELFIKSSYSLGLLLIVSIIFYFTTYGLNYIINFIFVAIIIELIIRCVIRVFLSIYTFNTLIKILINSNKE